MTWSFRALLLLATAVIVPACDLSKAPPISPFAFVAVGTPAGLKVEQSAYTAALWATGPTASSQPDSIVVLGSSVFVAYQDGLNPDGTIPPAGPGTAQGSNQIVQYDLSGNVVKTFTVPGHNDGLMVHDSNTLWAMSNEDSGPSLSIINLKTGVVTTLTQTPPGPAHAGGYDDMIMIDGIVYVSCSNPTLPAAPGSTQLVGIITLNIDGIHFDVAQAVASNIAATDVTTATPIANLNFADPDSMTIAPNGDLMVDGQGDSALAFIHSPGVVGAQQTVKVVPVTLGGNAFGVDDTRFAPAGGTPFMLVTDTGANTIYRIDAPAGFAQASFAKVPFSGTAYSAAGNGVFTLDMATGILSPLVLGLKKAHGLRFVTPPPAPPASVFAKSGFKASVFAAGPDGSSKPDSIVLDPSGNSVWVAFQGQLNPDGTIPPNGAATTQGFASVVQYDLKGNVLKTYSIKGHNDGMLAFAAAQADGSNLWVMANEDKNPVLTTINTATDAIIEYLPAVSPPVHLGGFDDMVMIGSTIYVTCSNPTLPAAPASTNLVGILSLTLPVTAKTFTVAASVASNSVFSDTTVNPPVAVTDVPTPALNFGDPDSMEVTPTGALLVDGQGDAALAIVTNPGGVGGAQSITRISLTLGGVATPVDDTRYVPVGVKFMLVTDTGSNLIYRIDASAGFNPGDVYCAGAIGVYSLNTASGALSPIANGMSKPHGMLFVH